MMKNIKIPLKSEFDVTDLGDLHRLLGIQSKFGPKSIEISQIVYIESIISQFGLEDCNMTILLIDQGTTLTQSKLEALLKGRESYQSMIKSIMYLVTGIKPDLTFTISDLV
jgi:hypothetical protein